MRHPVSCGFATARASPSFPKTSNRTILARKQWRVLSARRESRSRVTPVVFRSDACFGAMCVSKLCAFRSGALENTATRATPLFHL